MKFIVLSIIVVGLSACSSGRLVTVHDQASRQGTVVGVDIATGEEVGDLDDTLDALRGYRSGERDGESARVSRELSASGEPVRVQQWGSQEHVTRVMAYEVGTDADGTPITVTCFQGGNPPTGFYGALPERRRPQL